MSLGKPHHQARRENGLGRFSQNQENRSGKDSRIPTNAIPNSTPESTFPFHYMAQYMKS